ncbi:unnamed protein product [Leptidea sinapis]|uniref:Uncharacterized protein n=1 Tax=Leptidea sinapis TaxID=189913 RepID=A0A5E4R7E2_9NEOP|nr:unnamed protein product [Leptidea sinapis]
MEDVIVFIILAVEMGWSLDINPQLTQQEAVVFQNWYMQRVVDKLPLLEKISDCEECPRIYIPVCGNDNRYFMKSETQNYYYRPSNGAMFTSRSSREMRPSRTFNDGQNRGQMMRWTKK